MDISKYKLIAMGMALFCILLSGCKVTVPDVVGQPREAAVTMITEADLAIGTVSEAPNDNYPAGQVFGQHPAAGTKVAKDTAVDLSVSTGPVGVEGEGETPVEGEIPAEGESPGEGETPAEGEISLEGEGEIPPSWHARSLPPDIGDVTPMDISVVSEDAGWIVGMESITANGEKGRKGLFDEGEFDPFEGEGFYLEGEFDPFEAEDVFEEGEFPAGDAVSITGFALRLTPAGWSKMMLPDLGGNWSLFAVSATGASNAWLAGGDFTPLDVDLVLEGEGEGKIENAKNIGAYGAVILRDPGTGVVETAASTDYRVLSEAAAVGAADVWLATPAGVQRFKDGIWTVQTLPTTMEVIYALSFPTAEEGWAAGSETSYVGGERHGTISRLSGGTWSQVFLPNTTEPWELLDIEALPSGEVWAAGYSANNIALTRNGILLHYDGTAWEFVTLPTISTDWNLEALSMTGADAGWACGTDRVNKRGIMLRLRDGAWEAESMPGPASNNWTLTGLSMPDVVSGWAVGYDNQNAAMLLFEYGTV